MNYANWLLKKIQIYSTIYVVKQRSCAYWLFNKMGVDEQTKTYEICKLAVNQNNFAIKYVPIEKRTDEIMNIV